MIFSLCGFLISTFSTDDGVNNLIKITQHNKIIKFIKDTNNACIPPLHKYETTKPAKEYTYNNGYFLNC